MRIRNQIEIVAQTFTFWFGYRRILGHWTSFSVLFEAMLLESWKCYVGYDQKTSRGLYQCIKNGGAKRRPQVKPEVAKHRRLTIHQR